jgi:mono/diheme cytochrome c family protein
MQERPAEPAPPPGVAPPVDPEALEEAPAPQPVQPRPLQPAMPVPTGIGQVVTALISGDELAAAGQEVFMRTTCVACHAIANTAARGTLGPEPDAVRRAADRGRRRRPQHAGERRGVDSQSALDEAGRADARHAYRRRRHAGHRSDG